MKVRGIVQEVRRNGRRVILTVSGRKVIIPGGLSLPVEVGDVVSVEGRERIDRREGRVVSGERVELDGVDLDGSEDTAGAVRKILGRNSASLERKVHVLDDIIRILLKLGKKGAVRKILNMSEKEVHLCAGNPYRLFIRKKIDYPTMRCITRYKAVWLPDAGKWEDAAEVVKRVEDAYRSGEFPVKAEDLGFERSYLAELAELASRRITLEGSHVWLTWVYHMRNRVLGMIRREAVEEPDLPVHMVVEEPIRSLLKHRYSILTGPAGSGKTTLIRKIKEILESMGCAVKLTATTGKAASNLGSDATTIQKELGMGGKGRGRRKMFEVEKLDADWIIVDEASMMNWHLALALFRAAHNSRAGVILCGDPEQLPPVEGDNVFEKLMEVMPVVRMEKVHRFSGGEPPVEVAKIDPSLVVRRVVLAVKYFLNIAGGDWMKVQVITPTNKGEFGTVEMNRVLQEKLNPRGRKVAGGKFRIGDKVIVTKNCYDKDVPVYNGQMGIVEGEDEYGIWVRLSTGHAVSFRENEISLAYCLTVHKVQGSEFDYVVLVLTKSLYRGFVNEKLEYVGKTRGIRKTFCFVV